MKDIREALGVKKTLVLNMEEINYDRLIEFLQDMQTKNEKRLEIVIDGDTRKWTGFSTDKEGAHRYNRTSLN